METLIPKIVEQGGLFALAVFAIWALNAVWKERQTELQQRVGEEREDKLRLAQVLECNTAAITQLTTIVAELKRVVESTRTTKTHEP